MINYQLAKELQAADFPIKSEHTAEERHNSWVDAEGMYSNWDNGGTCVYVPTLSELIAELIAACGKDFERLTIQPIGDKWRADSWPFGGKKLNVEGYGPTPEEAVTRLYLAVHKPA